MTCLTLKKRMKLPIFIFPIVMLARVAYNLPKITMNSNLASHTSPIRMPSVTLA